MSVPAHGRSVLQTAESRGVKSGTALGAVRHRARSPPETRGTITTPKRPGPRESSEEDRSPRVYSRGAVRSPAPPALPFVSHDGVPGSRGRDARRAAAPRRARLPEPQPRVRSPRFLDAVDVRHPPPLKVHVLQARVVPRCRERRPGAAGEREPADRDVGRPLDPPRAARRGEPP